MKSRIASPMTLLICCIASVAFGLDVYVSPTGNDAAAGTSNAPLATLAAARDKVKGNGPATVYLHGGTYYLAAPIVFGPEHSGTAAAPMIYRAFPGETPVISGGIKVTSAWTTYSGSIMVTTIAQNLKVDQLFLNGKRQVLARYPNFDTTKDNGATRILDGYAADCISATRIARWANPAEGPGYIRGLHTSMWGGNSYIITGKSGSAIIQQWVGDNNRGSGIHATYRMVENLFEELDAPGEWFYRKSTGQLFFWPPAGTNLASATVELASQDECIRLVGSAAGSAGSVKYIQFNGITFTHTFRTLFSKPYETVLKSDWSIARTGTVFMQNAENIKITNCFFDQVGGNGIFVSGYNQHHLIQNNVFNDAGASCVALMGLNSAVRCPGSWSSTPTCTDRTPGPQTNEYPSFVTVDNNMMNHFGRFEKQPAGVALSRTESDTIRHNTIHDCPRAGICFCDGCWGGHVVEYNWVYNDVLETGDHGPFNAWGRDRNLRWQDDTTATTLDAWKTTIIRNNRFESNKGNFGIDLDDQASNYVQYNNLLIGGGLKLQWNRYNTYLNSILVNGANMTITGIWLGSQDYVARNIFTASYYFSFFPTGSYVPDTIKLHTKMIDSNCVTSTVNPGAYSWTQWHNAGLDVHSVTGDPMFTDTSKVFPNGYLPRGDYRVKAGSPALTIGFKNFPMDSFGVMTLPPDGIQTLFNPDDIHGLGRGRIEVDYRAGKLFVVHDGEYKVIITNVLGRTVKVIKGIGPSRFDIDKRAFDGGLYIVSIQSPQGRVSRKFAFVDK
jgi:hypothetical protein